MELPRGRDGVWLDLVADLLESPLTACPFARAVASRSAHGCPMRLTGGLRKMFFYYKEDVAHVEPNIERPRAPTRLADGRSQHRRHRRP